MWYDTIKKYYEMKFYTLENMKVFVKANYISEVQYKDITRQDYTIN